MAYVVESLIQHLTEQIELAPKLEMVRKPGGRFPDLLNRLREGINLAGEIPILKVVQGGARRYAACFQQAYNALEPLGATWEQIEAIKSQTFTDIDQKQKAQERLKGKDKEIVTACQEAMKHLKAAMVVIEDGERAEVKAGAK